jgi:hypothetical protein
LYFSKHNNFDHAIRSTHFIALSINVMRAWCIQSEVLRGKG